MALNKDKIFKAADKHIRNNKIEKAINEYETWLKQNPKDWNTVRVVGDLYHRIGRNDEAIKSYALVADAYKRDGFNVRAIATHKMILRLDSQNEGAMRNLAELQTDEGLLMEAKSHYQTLVELYNKQGPQAPRRRGFQKARGDRSSRRQDSLQVRGVSQQARQAGRGRARVRRHRRSVHRPGARRRGGQDPRARPQRSIPPTPRSRSSSRTRTRSRGTMRKRFACSRRCGNRARWTRVCSDGWERRTLAAGNTAEAETAFQQLTRRRARQSRQRHATRRSPDRAVEIRRGAGTAHIFGR